MKTIAYLIDPALGHVARAARIAEALGDAARIVFITPGLRKYVRELLGPSFEVHHIPIKNPPGYLHAAEFADGAQDLLDGLAPDLLMHDMCPMHYLTSMRFPSCPRVHVTNAFLTGPAGFETFQVHWFDRHGPRLQGDRTARGLPPLPSPFDLYDADLVLCADPGFVTAALPPLPGQYQAVGHIAYEVDMAVPEDLWDAEDLMILSMGSTGPGEISPTLLADLKAQSGASRVIYVGRPVAPIPGVDAHYDWLPLHRLLPKARLTVSQGGTGSSYQALAHGCPVAALPLHRNQEILGTILEARGVAALFPDYGPEARPEVRLDIAAMARAAREVQAEMAGTDGAANAADLIRGML